MLSRSIGRFFDFDELFDDAVLINMEKIRNACDDFDATNYEKNIINNDILKNSDYALRITKQFINDFLNNKYNLAYEAFLKKSLLTDLNDECFDDADGFVIPLPYKKRIIKVGLPEPTTFNNISVYPHEFGHYLNFKYAAKMHDDYLYREIPSILLQTMFVDYCHVNNYFKECGDLFTHYHTECIARYLYLPEDSFLDMDFSLDDESKETMDSDYFYEIALYYFGYIYTNRLYELYLEDRNKFKKKLTGLFFGDKLEHMLDYYNINMKDEKTVDTTLKLIKNYK